VAITKQYLKTIPSGIGTDVIWRLLSLSLFIPDPPGGPSRYCQRIPPDTFKSLLVHPNLCNEKSEKLFCSKNFLLAFDVGFRRSDPAVTQEMGFYDTILPP
jgi:hypothetical protein